MNPILKNILAVVLGAIIGGIVNMLIVVLSGSVVPLPEGVNPADPESLKESMHLFETKHYIMPFLAHALGTLVGALVCAKIAATKKMLFAMVIGVFFLFGGITNAFLLPAPTWFIVLDVVVAYLPMAWIGGKLGSK